MQTIQPQDTQSSPSISTSHAVTSSVQSDSWLNHLKHIWQQWFATLTTVPELKVWTSQDLDGEPLWCVYDPQADCVRNFGSEYAVTAWLEDYYGVE